MCAKIVGGCTSRESITSSGDSMSSALVHSLVPILSLRLNKTTLDGSSSVLLLVLVLACTFRSITMLLLPLLLGRFFARGTDKVKWNGLQISLTSLSRTISFVTLHTTGVRMGPLGDATHARDSLSRSDRGCSWRCRLVGRDDMVIYRGKVE
jgi:hypothetical protein